MHSLNGRCGGRLILSRTVHPNSPDYSQRQFLACVSDTNEEKCEFTPQLATFYSQEKRLMFDIILVLQIYLPTTFIHRIVLVFFSLISPTPADRIQYNARLMQNRTLPSLSTIPRKEVNQPISSD